MNLADAIILCNKRIEKAEIQRDVHIAKIEWLDEVIAEEQSKINFYQSMLKAKK